MYFSLRHSKQFGDFFAQSVEFLLENHRNLLKITQISQRQPASRLLLFFSSDKGKKNLCRHPSTIEYSENGLSMKGHYSSLKELKNERSTFDETQNKPVGHRKPTFIITRNCFEILAYLLLTDIKMRRFRNNWDIVYLALIPRTIPI